MAAIPYDVAQAFMNGEPARRGEFKSTGPGYFVTSERGPDEIRRYTVRRACADGSIDTVGEFQEHATAAQAKSAARAAA